MAKITRINKFSSKDEKALAGALTMIGTALVSIVVAAGVKLVKDWSDKKVK